MHKKFSLNNIYVREAKPTDINDVFELSNEKSIRVISFRQHKIRWPEHFNWFESKLKNNYCLFYVAEYEKKIIAQMRLDSENDKSLVSISVSKPFRKLGIGRKLFLAVIKKIKKQNLKTKTLVAQIKANNSTSISFFDSLGFKKMKGLKINKQEAYEYHLKYK